MKNSTYHLAVKAAAQTWKNSYIRYKISWMKEPVEVGPYFANQVEDHRRDIEGFEGVEWTKVFTK